MKANMLHPDGPIQRGFRLKFLPRSAPLPERIWAWCSNLWNEWQATMSDVSVDRFRKVALLLAVVLSLGLGFGAGQIASAFFKQDAQNTYMIYRSARTGEIKKILHPNGKEVDLTDEQINALRTPEVVPVK